MKKDVSSDAVVSVARSGSGARAVWLSLADTTWRVAVPTVLLSGLGIVADKKFETMPLLTLIGLVLGLIFAGMLVWRQLQLVISAEDKK